MISVLFQTESRYPVDRKKIRAAVERVLSAKVHSDTEVSISVVGDRRMRRLNQQYRQKDYATDVLSFGLNDPIDKNIAFVEMPDEVLRLGDIVVSYPQAVAQAGSEDKLVDDKVIELVLHGLNHLLGMHHPE